MKFDFKHFLRGFERMAVYCSIAKLKRTIATECPKESVRAEVADILYNAAEMFMDQN